MKNHEPRINLLKLLSPKCIYYTFNNSLIWYHLCFVLISSLVCSHCKNVAGLVVLISTSYLPTQGPLRATDKKTALSAHYVTRLEGYRDLHNVGSQSPIQRINDIQPGTFRFWFNTSSANPTKWSNTLKQFVGNLSVFDHFVELTLKGLTH